MNTNAQTSGVWLHNARNSRLTPWALKSCSSARPPPVHGTAAGGAPYFLNGTCIMTRRSLWIRTESLAALRQFNEMGAAAVKNLTAQANALEERIARLEEFQKTLIAPGDRSKAS